MVNVLMASKSEWARTQDDPTVEAVRSFVSPEERTVFARGANRRRLENAAWQQLGSSYAYSVGCDWLNQWMCPSQSLLDPHTTLDEIANALSLPRQRAAKRLRECQGISAYYEPIHHRFTQKDMEILEAVNEREESKSLLERLNDAYGDVMEPEEQEFLSLAKESYRRQLTAEE